MGWFGSKDREKKNLAGPRTGETRKEPQMANKKEKEPVRGPQTGELNALLGKGSEFEGKLVFEGTVRLDGKFKGEILSEGTLMLGDNAQFEGEIRVKRAVVSGQVNGNIHAESRLELHAPAKVKGNIVTSNLIVQEGVTFDGNCQMGKGATPKDQRPSVSAVNKTEQAGDKDKDI